MNLEANCLIAARSLVSSAAQQEQPPFNSNNNIELCQLRNSDFMVSINPHYRYVFPISIASGLVSIIRIPRILSARWGLHSRHCHGRTTPFANGVPYWRNLFLLQTEDEGNHGNDDTRCFILSTLASQGRSRVQCVLCDEQLLVFDRYPLVDGTFFLSPRQHAKSCIEVTI